MNKMCAHGKEVDRYPHKIITFEFDANRMIQLLTTVAEVKEDGDDDELESLYDILTEDPTNKLGDLVLVIARFDDSVQVIQYRINMIISGTPFYVIREEQTYGFGPNKDRAVEAYEAGRQYRKKGH